MSVPLSSQAKQQKFEPSGKQQNPYCPGSFLSESFLSESFFHLFEGWYMTLWWIAFELILCVSFQVERIRFCCQIFDIWLGSKVIFMYTLM